MDIFELEDSSLGLLGEFVRGVVNVMEEEGEEDGSEAVQEAFNPLFTIIHTDLSHASLLTFPRTHFIALNTLASVTPIARVCIKFYFI